MVTSNCNETVGNEIDVTYSTIKRAMTSLKKKSDKDLLGVTKKKLKGPKV